MRNMWWWRESTCMTTRTIYEAPRMDKTLRQVLHTCHVIHSHEQELTQVA